MTPADLTSRAVLAAALGMATPGVAQPDEPRPAMLGAVEASGWRVGALLASDDFDGPAALERWVVQIEPSAAGEPAGEVSVDAGALRMHLPGVGATAWFGTPLDGPVAVCYRVRIPTGRLNGSSVTARDVNTFVHATAPAPMQPADLLTDPRFNGRFPGYHPMNAYYTSTGGGDNTTTRLRVYPRTTPGGEPVDHVALVSRDGNPRFLLEPDRDFLVQVVVTGDGTAQYAVDGEVVYEVTPGGPVTVQPADAADAEVEAGVAGPGVPVHTGGYVGLRAVRTHHRYDAFRVWRLERPGAGVAPDADASAADAARVRMNVLAGMSERLPHEPLDPVALASFTRDFRAPGCPTTRSPARPTSPCPRATPSRRSAAATCCTCVGSRSRTTGPAASTSTTRPSSTRSPAGSGGGWSWTTGRRRIGGTGRSASTRSSPRSSP